MMMSDPISSTPRYRSPSATVSANISRYSRFNRFTLIPIVRAMSGDTNVTISACRCSRTNSVTAAAVRTPNTISGRDTVPAPPNSASIRSSPVVIRLPIASAAENTTPMMVSSARCERSSIAQTSRPAKSNMAAAPKIG